MPEQKREKGFTLIEVVAVLILFAIISAVVVSSMTSTAEVDIKAKAEALKNHIRYVQMRAMNADADTSTCSASFGISMSANSYFMFRNCDKTRKVSLPGADTLDVPLTNATLSPSADVTFDTWGRPCSDLYGSTLYTVNQDFAFGSETIRITKNTGYVP